MASQDINLEFKWDQLIYSQGVKIRSVSRQSFLQELGSVPKGFKSTAAHSGQKVIYSWLMLTDQNYYIMCVVQLYNNAESK
jgi:hypothetical protein